MVSAITLRLGVWQLDRAQQKEGIYSQQQAQMQAPALSNADFLSSSDRSSDLYRRVTLKGQWATDFTVYLANRSHGPQAGFWVLTPLCLKDKLCVLVLRGWAPRDWVDSNTLPSVSTQKGEVEIQGILVNPPSHMMELGSSGQETMKPLAFERLRQNIDINAYASETQLQIVASVQQLGEPVEGLIRLSPNLVSGSDKNRAYAAQWFALSALCVGLFIWFQIVQKLRHG